MTDSRVALDTNVLVSALLLADSTPARALAAAESRGVVIYSEESLAELTRVLTRPKFARYLREEEVEGLLARIVRSWECVAIHHRIRACRDPKDDIFLELAVNGHAGNLLTGDADLLALHPYRGVAILTPAEWLKGA